MSGDGFIRIEVRPLLDMSNPVVAAAFGNALRELTARRVLTHRPRRRSLSVRWLRRALLFLLAKTR